MASLFKETQSICIDDVGCVTLFPLRIKKICSMQLTYLGKSFPPCSRVFTSNKTYQKGV